MLHTKKLGADCAHGGIFKRGHFFAKQKTAADRRDGQDGLLRVGQEHRAGAGGRQHQGTRTGGHAAGVVQVVRVLLLHTHHKHTTHPKQNNNNKQFVKGDIQSMDLLTFLLETERVDTVMHFAAQTHVDNSFGNSLAFTMNNTYGTHVLLEAARKAGTIRRFVNVSTDEVYGETSLGKDEGLQEHSMLDPTNPYSAAKAGAEMMCKAYQTSYKMPIIITRGNNVYGPHQFPEKLIPKFIIRASRGAELPIHGDGAAVRSYLYVEDVATAFDAVLHRGVTGEVYNIGTDAERTVLDVARDVAAAFKLPESKVVHVKDRAFNDRRYYIGSDKLAALGWRETVGWEEGLKRCVAFFQWGVFCWVGVLCFWWGGVKIQTRQPSQHTTTSSPTSSPLNQHDRLVPGHRLRGVLAGRPRGGAAAAPAAGRHEPHGRPGARRGVEEARGGWRGRTREAPFFAVGNSKASSRVGSSSIHEAPKPCFFQ
jgi:UDP-glucose 4,6-dehydratase